MGLRKVSGEPEKGENTPIFFVLKKHNDLGSLIFPPC